MARFITAKFRHRAEGSADFYSSIFGWKVRARGDGNLAFDGSGFVSGTWVKEILAPRTDTDRASLLAAPAPSIRVR